VAILCKYIKTVW